MPGIWSCSSQAEPVQKLSINMSTAPGKILAEEAILLLQKLIATPSLSREEDATAIIIKKYLEQYCVDVARLKNNVFVRNKFFNAAKPTLLLNSHHDTVPANKSYTRNPHEAIVEDGKLFGLGSNDAGGCLVSLLACFLYFYEKENLPCNIIFAATAEEEISGVNGMELLFAKLGKIDLAIVGEPTQMNMAIAERGLMVLDCVATGMAGHAARDEGENAIYKAIQDIEWCRNFQFEKISELLGAVTMQTTIINAGQHHNVVPDECTFTIDVRLNEHYSHEDVLETLQEHLQSEIKPRSMRIRPSHISKQHPIVQAGLKVGKTFFGSPTTSDQALIPVASIKIGPGDSARSHTADEYIYLHEIETGIHDYINLVENFFKLSQ